MLFDSDMEMAEEDEEPMTEEMTATTKKKTKPKPEKKLPITEEELTTVFSLIASATSLSHTFLSQNDLLLLPSQTLTLESSIKSTALSLSSLLSLQTLNPPPLPPPPPRPSVSWFHRLFSSSDSDSDARFVESFHLSKPSFRLLLQTLSPSLQAPPELSLAAALFRLSHAAPYNSVARRFGIDSATACRAFYQVCKAVVDRLSHLFDLSPDRLSRNFGLPHCFGVLGYSRFFTDLGVGNEGTVVVQGLVDSSGRFLDVSAGWPSWMTPEAIFRQSKLYSRVTEGKELLNGASFDLVGGHSISPYVLGDSCCPLLAWLLTPYPKSSEAKDDSHRVFNVAHGRGMELVNNAFGRVLARWRLLSTRWKQECLEIFPFVVVVGCLLHNFLIDCGEPVSEDIGDYAKEQRFPEFDGNEDESGKNARDALALLLNMVSQKE